MRFRYYLRRVECLLLAMSSRRGLLVFRRYSCRCSYDYESCRCGYDDEGRRCRSGIELHLVRDGP